jgi:hypothetical protein
MNEALSEKAVLDKQREVLHPFSSFSNHFSILSFSFFFHPFQFSGTFHPFGPFSI